jgi:putative colanic acid biosynthesis UDP-glucose lipid carrier transferase
MKHGILQTHSSLISFFSQLIDILAIPFFLWISFQIEGAEMYTLEYILAALIAIVSFQFIANIRGLYFSMRGESLLLEIKKCVTYWLITFLSVFFTFYYFVIKPEHFYLIMPVWSILVVMYFILSRLAIRLGLRIMRTKGYNQRQVVIIGAGEVGLRLARNILSSPGLGIRLVGFYDDVRSGVIDVEGQKFEIVGDSSDLVNDARLLNIDRVYIALSMRHDTSIRKVVNELADTTCSVIYVPDMFSFDLLNSRMSHLNGMPVISIYDTPMEGANRLIKRIQDIVLSSLILVLISPILLVITIAVKATSSGPVLFKQNRYGIDGKAIKVLKFRSMTAMDNGDKVVQAQKGDVRITPLGAFLRKTSLDELPQFINTLNGSMSIVGPRPHAVAHNEAYRKLIGGYMLRHKVKPGITGWAQINGWRGETDTLNKMEKRIEFDLKYINNWSLLWDLKIIFLTIFKGFINKNAY